jgi:PKD repeat protein
MKATYTFIPKQYRHTLITFCSMLVAGIIYSQNPVPAFQPSQTSGCAPLNIAFHDLSKNTTSYLWDFGNGSSSILSDPSTVYLSPGTYTVKLVVKNSKGIKDSVVMQDQITVKPAPVSSFISSNAVSCLIGNEFSFSNNSINAGEWMWDFGDGNYSTLKDPKHSYDNPGKYTVKLIASNGNLCNSIKVRNNYIIVNPKPNADFNSNIISTCKPSDVFVFTPSDSSAKCKWDFGDGSNSILRQPTHTYNKNGVFTITLTERNKYGCYDTVVKHNYVQVYTLKSPDFFSNLNQGCSPLSVSFSDTTKGATSWLWNFGDGTTSTQQNPSHIYLNNGSYTVMLTINNNQGCSSSTQKNNYIIVNKSPSAAFTLDKTTGCGPLNIHSTNNSSGAIKYMWDLGNGDSSSAVNPSYTYLQNGTYKIKLRAIAANGCENIFTYSNSVVVEKATAGFSADITSGCIPLVVNFKSTSSAAVSFLWDFGDGTFSTSSNPAHTYTTVGSYNVRLIATTAKGCNDTLIVRNYIQPVNLDPGFTAPPLKKVCAPFTASFFDVTPWASSWYWDFGDGTNSAVQSPKHTYTKPGTYIVNLTIKTVNGCEMILHAFKTFEVKSIATGFTTILPSACSQYNVSFIDTTSNATSRLWSFGDGTIDNTAQPIHNFPGPGMYSISLKVNSTDGCSDQITKLGFVTLIDCKKKPASRSDSVLGPSIGGVVIPGPNKYIDTLALKPMKGCAPLSFHFNNFIPRAKKITWMMGDGSTSNQKNIKYTYTKQGDYSIRIAVEDSTGNIDTVIISPQIHVSAVKAEFSMTTIDICKGHTIAFTDSSDNAVTWKWNFGDGTIASIQKPTHTYLNQGAYDPSLTVQNSEGCTNVDSRSIYLGGGNILSANMYDVCSGNAVTFSSAAIGINKYLWDFGDGTTSTQQNPSHVYLQAGNYNVTFGGDNNSGCHLQYVLPANIQVHQPGADFIFLQQNKCKSLEVSFNNLSTGTNQPISNFSLWDFGDGSSAQWAANPVHTFPKAGTYTVVLKVFYNNNCWSSSSKTIKVSTITAAFSFTQDKQCLPVTVQYTDMSSGATSWLWDFGDDATSALQNPTHTFNKLPAKNVTLTANDGANCIANISKPNISVFKVQIKTNAGKGCVPQVMNFKSIANDATSWLWKFGDGSTLTNQDVTHTYTKKGTYLVTLVAQTANGCSDSAQYGPFTIGGPTAAFSSPSAATCAPSLSSFANTSLSAIKWSWDFGDSSLATLKNPSHIYSSPGSYSVRLVVSDINGCTDTLLRTDYIKVLGPTARFTVSDSAACGQLAVHFTNQSLNTNKLDWFFGDGSTSAMLNPVHTYFTGGKFKVSLFLTDSIGCHASYSLPFTLNVHTNPPSQVKASVMKGCVPQQIQFSDTISSGAVSWKWDFGDGTASAQQYPSHIYASKGTYTVHLTSKNFFGCEDTTQLSPILINKSSASITASSTTGCVPFSVTLNDTTGSNNLHIWDFGDGTTSNTSLATISHTYTTPGTYSVKLTAINSSGCTDTLVKNNFINVKGALASFNMPLTSGCERSTFSFIDKSTGFPLKWLWKFGDGDSSSAQQTQHTYKKPGNFNVSLKVTDTNGCTSEKVFQTAITINPLPVADFNVSGDKGCQPFSVAFAYKCTNIQHVTWLYGDGKSDTSLSVKHVYANPGKYTVAAIATTTQNCQDTLNVRSIEVLQTPVAAFGYQPKMICPSSMVHFIDSSLFTQNAIYKWVFDTDLSSSQKDPATRFIKPGSKTVSLIVINKNGCSDTLVKQGTVLVNDSTPPPASPILVVTVASNSSVDIAWIPSVANNFSSYIIYRKADNDPAYTPIATISNRTTAFFTDNSLNTLKHVYCYKIETLNSCGNSIALDQLNEHCTINVSAKVIYTENIKVDWTPYTGCKVANYEIYRTEPGSALPALVATVPANVVTYMDRALPCPTYYSYRIKATGVCGNAISSASDTSIAGPMPNFFADQIVDIIRSTVLGNDQIYTEWKAPQIHPEKVTEYKIYRSDDSLSYKLLTTVPSIVQNYTDKNVDIKSLHYYYRIEASNTCGIKTGGSNIGSSILLKAKLTDGNVQLNWTPYSGWNMDVDYYLIEKLNQDGKWEIIKKVDGKTLEYIDK